MYPPSPHSPTTDSHAPSRLKDVTASALLPAGAAGAVGAGLSEEDADQGDIDEERQLAAALAARPDGSGLGAQLRAHFNNVVADEVARKFEAVRWPNESLVSRSEHHVWPDWGFAGSRVGRLSLQTAPSCSRPARHLRCVLPCPAVPRAPWKTKQPVVPYCPCRRSEVDPFSACLAHTNVLTHVFRVF